jgi:hypothetical protein
MPDLAAERVRCGVPRARVVAVAEEAGPGGEAGGNVRRGALCLIGEFARIDM